MENPTNVKGRNKRRRVLLACFRRSRLPLLARHVEPKPTRLANAKFGLKLAQNGRAGVAFDALNQKFSSFAAQLVLGQFHRSESWAKHTQPGIIVEADQAEILRTP